MSQPYDDMADSRYPVRDLHPDTARAQLPCASRASPRFIDLAAEESRAGFVPVSFPRTRTSADCCFMVQEQPMSILAPPYRLQVSAGAGRVQIRGFKIGNQYIAFDSGELMNAEHLWLEPSAAPAGLQLIDGPICEPALRISVEVITELDTYVDVTFWGMSFEQAKRLRKIAELAPDSVNRLIARLEGELEAVRATREKELDEARRIAQNRVSTPKILQLLANSTLLDLQSELYSRGHLKHISNELDSATIHALGELLGAQQKFDCKPVVEPAELARREHARRSAIDRANTYEHRRALGDDGEGGNDQWSTACDES